jgi:hypothetical protein
MAHLYDTSHKDTQQKVTYHNNIQHNNTDNSIAILSSQLIDIQLCNTQHNEIEHNKNMNDPNNLILTVVYAEWRRAIMLNVIMLSVVAPHSSPDDFQHDQNRNKEK